MGEQGHRCALGPKTRLAKLGFPENGLGLILVDIAGVEEAKHELLAQESSNRLIDPRLSDAAGPDCIDYRIRAEVSPELVHACFNRLDDAPFKAQLLDPPGTGRGWLSEELKVGQQTPVRTHDAVKSEALTEEPGDDRLVEGESHFLVLRANRHPVVRHHLRPMGCDGCFERKQVELELVARVDLLAPVVEVGVLAILLRTATGKVLRHGGD